ncbi:hypothetical protein N7513_005279 [Penicillium frequentans]|nr:hypothetical protein N7513_005279 [Penicillium glabrum]
MPQPIFSNHHDQGKGSTPTLAGSNGGAAFLSRHSSASTLNHHEIDDLGRRWDTPEPSYDRAEPPPAHNSDTHAWTNNVGQNFYSNVSERETSPSDTTPYQPSQPSIDQDSINGKDHPLNLEPASASPRSDEQTSIPTQDDERIHQPIEQPVSAPIPAENLGAMPFLFHSILPINPALPFSRHRTWPSGAKDTQPSLPTYREPIPDNSALLEHLYRSRLPINPALKDDIYNHSSKRELFESRLPINPAVQDGFARSVSAPLEPVPSTSAIIEEAIQLSPLVESRLPINPAVEDGPVMVVSSLRERYLSTSATVVNDPIEPSPLVESSPPISPAVENGSMRVSSSPLESRLPTRECVKKDVIEFSPSLVESRLPINPAVEDGSMKMASSLPEPQPPTKKAEHEPVGLVSTILESQLPINPTVEDGFVRCVVSPVKSQLSVTQAIDSNSVRLIPSLVESRLPINPASREYL